MEHFLMQKNKDNQVFIDKGLHFNNLVKLVKVCSVCNYNYIVSYIHLCTYALLPAHATL